jgi:hypothetical protein
MTSTGMIGTGLSGTLGGLVFSIGERSTSSSSRATSRRRPGPVLDGDRRRRHGEATLGEEALDMLPSDRPGAGRHPVGLEVTNEAIEGIQIDAGSLRRSAGREVQGERRA